MKIRFLVVLLAGALSVGACSASSDPTASSTSMTAVPTTSGQSSTTASEAAPPCLSGDQPFATAGALAAGLLDGGEGDAEQVSALRWTAYEGCEQLVVELTTAGGAPATEPGGVRAELLRDLGVVRLRLDERVTTTAVADRLIEHDLVDRVYVVRSLAGPLYVDIHLASAAVARASVSRSPAAVVVDLQAGGPDLTSQPVTADVSVLVTPTRGKIDYPFAAEGYARTFEANVILRLRQGNRLDVEQVTTAADYLMTWGEYRFDVESGPNGNVEMFVGDDSPQDGQEEGARVSLVMG